MRRSLLSLCLLPVLLAGCSTVRVSPGPVQIGPVDIGPAQPVRSDVAATQGFPPGDSDGYRPPAQLAVLLPMSGSAAPAANAVRDGFLSAYYGEPRQRPVVRFYDSRGTGAGAQAALARAMAEGAQMIVGPLTREEVNAVGNSVRLPWVALNRGSALPAQGTTSFALLPDDEGRGAAQRLLARNIRSVLVFSNRSDNAQRAVNGFRQAFIDGGGVVSSEIAMVGETPDLGAQLSGLMAGPTPPAAVFLALEAGQARAIAAQLKISPLAALPRIATSLILSGANARSDVELDGIEYPELPWLLGQGGGLPDAGRLAGSLPSARGPSQRLFAFGADAWRLTAYFERLYNQPAFAVRGATGGLQIGLDGTVVRTPSWAVFSGGSGRAVSDTSRAADGRQAAY